MKQQKKMDLINYSWKRKNFVYAEKMTSNQAFLSPQGLYQKYCFESKNLYIKGYWDETKVKSIWVTLLKYANTTENNNTCKSYEEIDKFLLNGTYFNTYYSSQFIDVEDHSNPIKEVWRNPCLLERS